MHSSWVSINPAKKRFRYYAISLANDLFDEFVVTCEWGRIGAKRLHCKVMTFDSLATANTYIEHVIATRLKHQYIPA